MSAARPALSREAADARAVIMWREGKNDTLNIAHATGLKQHEVCRAIVADQDARHRSLTAAGKGACQ